MPDFSLEQAEIAGGHGPVAGVDEAGRGPWAGPVVAAAVILNRARIPGGLDDSKALTHDRRVELLEALERTASIGVGMAEADEIDRDNILAATMAAMARAVSRLDPAPGLVLIDGNRMPELAMRAKTIVKGDRTSLSVAAASIVAKVTRDRLMAGYDTIYPGYGFARHKGYGTRQHGEALDRLGVCPIHRRSFKPIRERLARPR